jgi:hypothetical protein
MTWEVKPRCSNTWALRILEGSRTTDQGPRHEKRQEEEKNWIEEKFFLKKVKNRRNRCNDVIVVV